jgi:N-acetylmuramic acid 6-phosphate etherase
LCYLAVAHTHNSNDAWKEVLGRVPRGLNWPNLDKSVGVDEIYAFDISENAIKRRSHHKHYLIDVSIQDQKLLIEFDQNKIQLQLGECLLTTHLCLKLLMNTHSTLVMGKLDRYQSNMMTWVSPSNYKLIDRAARYVIALAKQKNKNLKYEKVVEKIFEIKNQQDHQGKSHQAIVVLVLNKML